MVNDDVTDDAFSVKRGIAHPFFEQRSQSTVTLVHANFLRRAHRQERSEC